MHALRSLQWFYRRPFFWWALAAIGAVGATCAGPVPVLVWWVLLGSGWLVLIAGARWLAVTLVVASLFGLLTVRRLEPPSAPGLRADAPVTLRGVLSRPQGQRDGSAFILTSDWRRTRGGWVQHRQRYGIAALEGGVAGQQVEVSGVLRRPEPATNPGGYSARLAWLRRDVHWLVHVRPFGLRVLGRHPPPAWQVAGDRLRETILQTNRRTLPPAAALMANSFLIGETETPDPELQARVESAFRDSGTIHLLVVSGTQVTLVLGLFVWLGWRFWRHRYLWWLLGLGVLGLFYITTSGDASVTRAAVMGGVFVLGIALMREPDRENCLGIAALLLMLMNPLAVFDVGAQLSFVAVWALVRLAPALQRALGPAPPTEGEEQPPSAWRTLHGGAAGVAAACLSAHLATTPILELHFQRAAWGGVVANGVVALLATAFLYLAIAHLVLSVLGAPLLGGVVSGMADALFGWAGFFAGSPLGAADVFPAPLWLVPLCLAGVGAPSILPRLRSVPIALAGVVVVALLLSERLPAAPPRYPTLRALDVGQGDCILLQGPDGSNILVDAGPDRDAPVSPVLRTLRELRIPALDAVVVSHAHADHVGELAEVLDGIPVRLLIHGPVSESSDEWREVLATAARRRVPILQPRAGDRLLVRQSILQVLGPLPDGPANEVNEESLVVRWDSGGARFLLPGDAEAGAEAALQRWGEELRADVLKVAHHGSRSSTGASWLQAVRPRVGVISCGRYNRFGHPAAQTLGQLERAGVPVVRTDRSGMVTVRVRGQAVEAAGYVTTW